MEKRDEIMLAKKRRAKLLDELNKTGCTATKLATKHKVTPQRMSQLLTLARKEAIDAIKYGSRR